MKFGETFTQFSAFLIYQLKIDVSDHFEAKKGPSVFLSTTKSFKMLFLGINNAILCVITIQSNSLQTNHGAEIQKQGQMSIANIGFSSNCNV